MNHIMLAGCADSAQGHLNSFIATQACEHSRDTVVAGAGTHGGLWGHLTPGHAVWYDLLLLIWLVLLVRDVLLCTL
jgi:hypothetical protein